MKRDRALIFQFLVSAVLIALAGLAGMAIFAGARLSQQYKTASVAAAADPLAADQAEWNQFYDAVSGERFARLGRKVEGESPVESVTENPAAIDPANAAAATQIHNAPVSPSSTSETPIDPSFVSRPASGEVEKADAPATQAPAPSELPHERAEAAPAVTAAESTSPAAVNPIVSAPTPAPNPNAGKSVQTVTPPAAPAPRAKVATPKSLGHVAARAKQAARESERKTEQSRPSRTRVASPRQRHAPQSDRPPWIDPQYVESPQQQFGTLSYAPQYDGPPGGPKFGPYFPYGSSPPPAQRSRTQQNGWSRPFDAQPYDLR